ncbi:Myb-like transcription factor [Aspergillus niger ATCC 13496]|uniref:Myb-like transcription factor n=1 Tax=Aspergillus niger ATCC 13496 TaxID=1353008 RepID=A0A370CCU2_ASPNG|nr:Myb-like transcription factor [Aspergillus niger ATCC 13496]
MPQTQIPPQNPRKRRASPQSSSAATMAAPGAAPATGETAHEQGPGGSEPAPKKKGRTNTPWTAEEEQRLKTMRDAGRTWSEIAKTFPTRTEALREAIREYDANKWKAIGLKVGKPAKACEQYAKEHFKDL